MIFIHYAKKYIQIWLCSSLGTSFQMKANKFPNYNLVKVKGHGI